MPQNFYFFAADFRHKRAEKDVSMQQNIIFLLWKTEALNDNLTHIKLL